MRDKILAAIAGKCHNDTAAELATAHCIEIAKEFAVDFGVWACKQETPRPFMADPRYELMIEPNDTEDQIAYKISKLLSLYLESLTARKG